MVTKKENQKKEKNQLLNAAKNIQLEIANGYLDEVIKICLEIKDIKNKLKQKRKLLAGLITDNRDLFKGFDKNE